MNTRVYLLLDIADGKSKQAALTLRDMPGVVIADHLEGRPNVLVLVEASDRLKLAEFLMSALASIDNFTEDLLLLVARDTMVPVAISSPLT